MSESGPVADNFLVAGFAGWFSLCSDSGFTDSDFDEDCFGEGSRLEDDDLGGSFDDEDGLGDSFDDEAGLRGSFEDEVDCFEDSLDKEGSFGETSAFEDTGFDDSFGRGTAFGRAAFDDSFDGASAFDDDTDFEETALEGSFDDDALEGSFDDSSALDGVALEDSFDESSALDGVSLEDAFDERSVFDGVALEGSCDKVFSDDDSDFVASLRVSLSLDADRYLYLDL